MPTNFIGTGSPTGLTVNGCVIHDAPYTGLFALVTVVPASSGQSYTAYPSRTCTYGASNLPMTSLGVVNAGTGTPYGWVELFWIKDVDHGAGATSKVVFTAGAATTSIGIETMTYSNVSQVTPGSVTTFANVGINSALFVASSPGKFVVAGFGCSKAITGASAGNLRANANSGTTGNVQNSGIIDGTGASVVPITAIAGSSSNWGAVACSIDFIVAANQDQQKIVDGINNAVTNNGTTGNALTSVDDNISGIVSGTANVINNFEINGTQDDANTALAHLVATGRNAAAQIVYSDSPPPNSGFLNKTYNFGAFSDSTSMPGVFTRVDGAGTGNYGILDGKTEWTGLSGSKNSYVFLNEDTVSEYQKISLTPFSNTNNNNAYIGMVGRVSADRTKKVLAYFFPLAAQLVIMYNNNGSLTSIGAQSGIVFNPTAKYELLCGDVATDDPDKYTILKNGVEIYSASSSAGLAPIGDKGLGWWSQAQSSANGDQEINLIQVSFSDQWLFPGPPKIGGHVAANESTGSTGPVQLTTKTDVVDDVLIGSSGMAEVCLDAFILGSVANNIPAMTFDLLAGDPPLFGAAGPGGVNASPSWTHTPDPDDNFVILPVTYTSGFTATYGGVAMNTIGAGVSWVGGAFFALMGLFITPGAGAKTVQVTGGGTAAGDSLSYANVGGVGVPEVAGGTGTAVTHTILNTDSAVVVQLLAANALGTGNSIGSYTKNSRFTKPSALTNYATLIGDMAGGSSVTGAATLPVSSTWGSYMIPLLGADCMSASDNIANGRYLGYKTSSGSGQKAGNQFLIDGLAPGLTRIIPRYCVISGGGTGAFGNRRCTVKPL
jgi:hypothetical protein